MITLDFFKSFGYGRKYWHGLVSDHVQQFEMGKDYINKAVAYFESIGEDGRAVRERMVAQDRAVRPAAEAFADSVLMIMVDALNSRGLTEDEVRTMFHKDA